MNQLASVSYHRRVTWLALITFALAFVVILLGAYTRLTNAGLSCPDWPHCYGYLTAPHTATQLQQAMQRYPMTPVDIKKAWTEMTHRYFAGTEGILILLLIGVLWRTSKLKQQHHLFKSCLLIGLLGMQVTLGMLTVTEQLKPVIVLGHLLTGLSILCVLWWIYLDLKPLQHTTHTRLIPALWLGFIIVALQITLGGWVSTHYAGLACIDLPYCNGQLLPTLHWDALHTDLITIHMLHRIGAIITACYLILLAFCLACTRTLRSYAILIFLLISLQITLGVLNIMWLRPVWIALIHQGVAILLLLTMVALLIKARRHA